MGQEIISLHVGACGTNIGEVFYDVIAHEHCVTPCGAFIGTSALRHNRVNVYFNESAINSYYARAICIDLDKSSSEKLRTGPQGLLFSPGNIVYKEIGGSGNNFARGFHTEGKELLDEALELIRNEVESCDSLQGFQVVHSLGGGTGSGLGSLLLNNLTEEYPKYIVKTYSIIPSAKISEVVVEPYNFMLSMPHLMTHSHLTFGIDNEALHDICIRRLNITTATNRDLNHIISHTMSGITTCLRFPGQLNSGLRKLYTNMCPFPNLHFLIPGFAPLTSCQRVPYEKVSVAELVQQIFSPRNVLATIDMRKSKIFTMAAIFRGRISPKEVDGLMTNARNKNLENFVNWIPNNIKTAICDVPPKGLVMSATFIANTCGFRDIVRRIESQFISMYNKKAYLHWYLGEGMEEQEFTDAHNHLKGWISEYEIHSKDVDLDEGSDCCMVK